jgi:hypothetical protein
VLAEPFRKKKQYLIPKFDRVEFRVLKGCVILRSMMQSDENSDWIIRAKARGFDGALAMLCDALAPLGPLGAQILWVMQPLSGWFGWRDAVGGLAEALEEPDGIERLRQRLEADLPEEGQAGETPAR